MGEDKRSWNPSKIPQFANGNATRTKSENWTFTLCKLHTIHKELEMVPLPSHTIQVKVVTEGLSVLRLNLLMQTVTAAVPAKEKFSAKEMRETTGINIQEDKWYIKKNECLCMRKNSCTPGAMER